MSRSAALGAVLRRLGICGLVLRARRRGWLRPDALTILGYHRINAAPEDGFMAADENISCTATEFEREVSLLRRYFTPIGFRELLAISEGGNAGRRPSNPLIVTLDDGYRDNFETAAPILRRHGMSATFFLTTGFLDGEALPWWDAINSACRRAPAATIRLAALDGVELDLHAAAGRVRAARELRRRFRSLSPARFGAVLEELGRAAGCELSPRAFQADFMGWEEARSLAAGGFEIGAHTRTHPVLTQLESSTSLDEELGGSRRLLEERLETPVIALAYPVGGPSSVSKEVIAAARRAGFRFACTYQDGVNRLRRLDFLALRRIAVGTGTNYAQFYVKMAFPWLFRRTNV